MKGEKIYLDGQWFFDDSMRGFWYQPAGYYEIAVEPDRADWKFISDREAQQLIPKLEDEGYIKPRLDERLRTEDLKITHRLLDLLEK